MDVPAPYRFQSWQKSLSKSDRLLTPLAHSSHWWQYLLSSSSNAINIDSIVNLYTGHDISEVRVGCKINRFVSAKVERITSVSFISRFCLAFCMPLFCSPELYYTSVNSWNTTRFVSAQAGMDNSQISCCSGVPLPLVRPSLVFRLRVNTCLITSSVDSAVP